MSASEEDLSSYLAYESVSTQILSVFVGFTFTAITILLTLLPNPAQIGAQVLLFFLALIYYMLQFVIFFSLYYLSYCVKVQVLPPEAKGRRSAGLVYFFSLNLWGLAIVLMFLLWNLTYLALATGIVYVVFTVLTSIYAWKPMLERMKRIRSQK